MQRIIPKNRVLCATLLFMLLAGIIGGLIAGPELSAMADTVLRSLRDEPGYWWETYRRVWKRNARESLVPGMLTGLVLSMQIFTLFTCRSSAPVLLPGYC